MVAQHYRWDFIGLSTDEKPTPQTSEKVVDGSTFYCSDNSKLYVFCGSQWYEKVVSGGGQYVLPIATDETLGGVKVGSNLSINSETGVLSATDTTYTAGTNVTISEENVISATDTTYSNFTGTDGTQAGTAGLVPAPATTDAGKFLKADGTWDTAGGGGVTPVQTTGTSTTEVMSQDATTKLVFSDITNSPAKIDIGNTKATTLGYRGIKIGLHTQVDTDSVGIGNMTSTASNTTVAMQSVAIGVNAYTLTGDAVAIGYNTHALKNGIAIGSGSYTGAQYAVAIGQGASAQGQGSVAIGNESRAVNKGEVNIGTTNTSRGWNGNSTYRVLRGVYDAQEAHDAVNLSQLQNAILNGGTTAPTTATVGAVGTLYTYVDTGNNNTPHLLVCTDTTGGTYTWSQLI